MFNTELTLDVQQNADLVKIVSSYVELKVSRRAFKAPCPFHTDHASSLMVLPDKNIFKCFGCGKDGGPIEFVMLMENKTYSEAVLLLSARD